MFNDYIPNYAVKANPALQLLKESIYRFTLCGSRKYGGATDDSDWDFWAQSHAELQQWLENNGFENLSDEHYEDPGETVLVLRNEEHKVDVSLQKSLELSETAGRLIFVHLGFTFGQMTKEQRNKILTLVKAALRRNWTPTPFISDDDIPF